MSHRENKQRPTAQPRGPPRTQQMTYSSKQCRNARTKNNLHLNNVPTREQTLTTTSCKALEVYIMFRTEISTPCVCILFSELRTQRPRSVYHVRNRKLNTLHVYTIVGTQNSTPPKWNSRPAVRCLFLFSRCDILKLQVIVLFLLCDMFWNGCPLAALVCCRGVTFF